MVAVIANGGKQYKVEPDKVVELEKIDKPIGEEVYFDNVLAVIDENSRSFASQSKVVGIVMRHFRGKKVIAYKKRRRNFHSARTKGHRQYYTAVLIKSILNQ